MNSPFAVSAFFGGTQSQFVLAFDVEIPAEAFAPGREQPKYHDVPMGLTMMLRGRNTAEYQAAFRGRIVGRERLIKR